MGRIKYIRHLRRVVKGFKKGTWSGNDLRAACVLSGMKPEAAHEFCLRMTADFFRLNMPI